VLRVTGTSGLLGNIPRAPVLMVYAGVLSITYLSIESCGPTIGKDVEWYNPKERMNCTWCNLEGADLSGAYLQAADLSEANLKNTNLQGADLSYSDLRYSHLHNANLTGANLDYANLGGAILDGAIGADFSRAFNVSFKYLKD